MAAEYRRPRVARAAALSKDVERALSRHRDRIAARHAVKTADGLVRMVDDLGFCFAFTGEAAYPIPAAFDHLDTRSDGRKWEWMWGWKDELAEKKRLYYGKLLVKKPTFVSMKMLPTFYATFGRAGDPDDHLEDVRAGRLSGDRATHHRISCGEWRDADQTDAIGPRHHVPRGQIRLCEGDRGAAAPDVRGARSRSGRRP
jgi:hypothetical protein